MENLVGSYLLPGKCHLVITAPKKRILKKDDFRDGGSRLTEMFHIILMAKGRPPAGASASSPREGSLGPSLEEAGPGSLPPPGSGATQAWRPHRRRHCSPCQWTALPDTPPAGNPASARVSSGSGSSLFFWVKTACEENEQAL